MPTDTRDLIIRAARATIVALPVVAMAGLAFAQVEGQPTPGGVGLPATVTDVGR